MAVYVSQNPRTKKALKELVGTTGLPKSDLFKPSHGFGLGTEIPDNGTIFLEGPHYPQPHSWYGKGTMKDGRLVKVT